MADGCYACEQASAEAPFRERFVRTGGWRVAHDFNSSLAGWLIVAPLRHIRSLDELSADEAVVLGELLRKASIALMAVTGCEKTYVMLFTEAEGFAHLHVHVVPRMPDQPDDRRGPPCSATCRTNARSPLTHGTTSAKRCSLRGPRERVANAAKRSAAHVAHEHTPWMTDQPSAPWASQVVEAVRGHCAQRRMRATLVSVHIGPSQLVEVVYSWPGERGLRGIRFDPGSVQRTERGPGSTAGELAFDVVLVGIEEPRTVEDFSEPDADGVRWLPIEEWLGPSRSLGRLRHSHGTDGLS